MVESAARSPNGHGRRKLLKTKVSSSLSSIDLRRVLSSESMAAEPHFILAVRVIQARGVARKPNVDFYCKLSLDQEYEQKSRAVSG